MCDTQKVFLKVFFKSFDFDKNQITNKHEKLPMGQRVNLHANLSFYLGQGIIGFI